MTQSDYEQTFGDKSATNNSSATPSNRSLPAKDYGDRVPSPSIGQRQSLMEFCRTKNATKIAIRPFVKLRSVNEEHEYEKLNYFGDILNGPCIYHPKAINHNICAMAYFFGNLGKVSNE